MHTCRGSEYQCEVGLITRNILLQGYAGADQTSVGAHIIIMGEVGCGVGYTRTTNIN
jgi:hypothetical protein